MNILGWIGDILLVAAVWFLAEKKRYSFLVQASGSLVWGINALFLHMYDLVALNIVFIALALRAWQKWGQVIDPNTYCDYCEQIITKQDGFWITKNFSSVCPRNAISHVPRKK